MAFITKDDLMQATDGGMLVFEFLYGAEIYQARERSKEGNIQFCIDGEKNPSASLKRMDDGTWVLTNFRDDQVTRNAINHWMHIKNVEFLEAINQICAALNLHVEGKSFAFSKPSRAYSPATDEPEGFYQIDALPEFTLVGSEVMGALASSGIAKRYGFHQIKSYCYRKDDKIVIVSATDEYPIFAILEDKWSKIYEPLNQDKGFRFRYFGQKPKIHLFGFKNLIKTFEDYNKDEIEDENEGEEDGAAKKSTGKKKLEYVALMSGERDAMNMAAVCPVVWMNSETAALGEDTYASLTRYAKKIYYVPDLDETGIKAGRRLGLRYLDIFTLWLPDEIQKKRYRGKPGKDFRDYVDTLDLYVPARVTDPLEREKQLSFKRGKAIKKVKELFESAYPTRFWDEVRRRKEDNEWTEFKFRPTYAYNFLYQNGYGLLASETSKDGYMLVHNEDNVIRDVRSAEIKQFVNRFARQRKLPAELLDVISRTTLLSDSSLYNMHEYHLDFTDFGPGFQWLFFNKVSWLIRPEGITQYKGVPQGINVWKNNIIEREVSIQEEPFTIVWDGIKECYTLKINNLDSNYFKILVNTSRVHWRTEIEENLKGASEFDRQEYVKRNRFNIAGDSLGEDEIFEQEQHLINKIFTIGYILHKYKDLARTWAVFAMDNKISEDGESHGRSGKSLVLGFLKKFMNAVDIGGRDPKITANQHIYEKVTRYTDVVFVDDANKYLDFDFFYPVITGGINVNPKNVSQFYIPFEESPKLIITSNFTPKNNDPSTEARLLYNVFSDWYHQRTDDNDYNETHRISDDFGGRTLFDSGYSAKEWNDDLNFIAYCLRFYLCTTVIAGDCSVERIKVDPPMGNVKKRSLIAKIGTDFIEWADVYFEGRWNLDIRKDETLTDFILTSKTPANMCKPHAFTKKLKRWCTLRGYILNRNANTTSGRIVKRCDFPMNTSVEWVNVYNNKQHHEQTNYPPAQDRDLFPDMSH